MWVERKEVLRILGAEKLLRFGGVSYLAFQPVSPSGLTLLVPPEILANINTLVFLDSLVTDIAGIAFHLLEKGLLIVRSL